jgi:hypothetical protein
MDKPQNLLEPPISNYQNNIVKVNSKDLSNSQEESQNKLQDCAGMLSSVDCSAEVYDKPTLNPTTDDKPTLNPTTDDESPLNCNIDIENIPSEENRNVNTAHDFLASVTN